MNTINMKNIRSYLSLLLLLLLINTTAMTAQTAKSGEFLFEGFQDAYVYYKDGKIYNVDINYSLLDKRYYFYNKNQPDQIETFGDIQPIASIKIGERYFRVGRKGEAIEVLQFEPFIGVEYRGQLREAPKNVGYGGTSETSAVNSVSSIQSGGVTHRLNSGGYILHDMSYYYQVEINGKNKSFQNRKQFLKLFAKQEAQITQYIEEKAVSFDKPEEVLKLCNYALSLR